MQYKMKTLFLALSLGLFCNQSFAGTTWTAILSDGSNEPPVVGATYPGSTSTNSWSLDAGTINAGMLYCSGSANNGGTHYAPTSFTINCAGNDMTIQNLTGGYDNNQFTINNDISGTGKSGSVYLNNIVCPTSGTNPSTTTVSILGCANNSETTLTLTNPPAP